VTGVLHGKQNPKRKSHDSLMLAQSSLFAQVADTNSPPFSLLISTNPSCLHQNNRVRSITFRECFLSIAFANMPMQEFGHCTRLAAVRQPLPAVAIAAVAGLPELRTTPKHYGFIASNCLGV